MKALNLHPPTRLALVSCGLLFLFPALSPGFCALPAPIYGMGGIACTSAPCVPGEKPSLVTAFFQPVSGRPDCPFASPTCGGRSEQASGCWGRLISSKRRGVVVQCNFPFTGLKMPWGGGEGRVPTREPPEAHTDTGTCLF